MAQATTVTYAGPATGTERSLAEVLAEVVRVERVSVDSHFFEDLGADSMVMAQFCARVRKRPELPSVSMKDVYRHPTIRGLATALAGTTPTPIGEPAPAPAEVPVVGRRPDRSGSRCPADPTGGARLRRSRSSAPTYRGATLHTWACTTRTVRSS